MWQCSVIKARVLVLLIFLFAMFFVKSVVQAEDSQALNIGYGAETETNSKYIWRGLSFSQGIVQQSTLWLSASNLTASIWSNYDLSSEASSSGFNEMELSLGYSASFAGLAIEPALAYYTYPNQEENPATSELALKCSYTVSALGFFTTHTFDLKEYPGAYFGEIGMTYEKELFSFSTLEVMMEYCWGSKKFSESYVGEYPGEFRLFCGSLSTTNSFLKSFYLKPHLSYYSLLNHSFESVVEHLNHWQTGLAIGVEF